MKFEDVKVGMKVKLVSTLHTEEQLGYSKGSMLSVGECGEVNIVDGKDHSVCFSDDCWYSVKDLEPASEQNQKSDNTNIGNLTVSISLEDKQEIAKDILKIALQDLNVIISNAIEDLSDDKEEEVAQPELDFSNEKLQTLFDEAIKEVIKEQMQDAISSLNKTAFNI